MRVCHFSGGSMRPGHDGVTRVMYRMREIFQREGGQHHFVSPILPENYPQDMRRVSSIPFPLSTDYRLSFCSANFIRKILREVNADVIHIHSPCPLGFAAVQAGRSLQIPIVATYHTHFPTYLKYYKTRYITPLMWKYLQYFYNRCNSVIVPSQATLKELKLHGFKNLIHIPHGVDTQIFSPEFRCEKWRRSAGVRRKSEKCIVTFVGRLVWEKNLRLLAEIMKLTRLQERIQFVVVGDGPAREKLEEMMPGAIFTGQLGEKDLQIAYASSDLFVFPSVTETFGNVTIEAMASGLPVVCASAGGAQDMVVPGVNGVLSSGHDAQEFADAIDQLVGDPALRARLSQGALQTAINYRWENTVGQYRNVYSQVLRESPVEMTALKTIMT